MRPRGHVLQVSQGKGLTLAAAQWSALSEAIELAAAENPDVSSFSFGPGPEGSPWDVDGLCVAWVPGVRLNDRKPCVVPAQSVYCPARWDVLDGPVDHHLSIEWAGRAPHVSSGGGRTRGARVGRARWVGARAA